VSAPTTEELERAIEAARSVELYLGRFEGGEVWDESTFVREILEGFLVGRSP